MIATNSPIWQVDQDAIRRQALAKVYMLLLRLAEETEAKTSTSDNAVASSKNLEVPVSVE